MSTLMLMRDWLGRKPRLVWWLAAALLAGNVSSTAIVTVYTAGQHAYDTLIGVAAAFLVFSLAIAGLLAFLRYPKLCAMALLISVVGEWSAVRAVFRFREDFDSVLPRPLAEQAALPAAAVPVAPKPTTEPTREDAGTAPREPISPAPSVRTEIRIDLEPGPGDFPQFLGPQRTASIEEIKLSRDWATTPPQRLWRQPIGAGWGGFSVVNGYAVTLEQRGNEEVVAAYNAASGQRLWSYAVPARYSNDRWPESGVGPRSSPTIADGRVYTLGATGRFLCLDGATGKLLWEKDLLKEFNVTPDMEKSDVPYGRSNSPLVVDDLVIIPAGGPRGRRVSLVAYDRKTGERRWEAGDVQVSHSSPSLVTFGGVRQIVSVNENTVTGHDVATGAVLWEQSWPGKTTGSVNASQAVAAGPNRFFVSKSYGGGGALYELSPRDHGQFTSREIWKSNRVMRTRFTNVTIRDRYVYGLSDGILECIDVETGERVWKGGRFGHGQILRAGDMLLVVSEDGEVVLIEASPETSGEVLGRFQAIEGMTWNSPALSNGILLVRNAQEAAAYRLPIATEPESTR